MSALHSRVTRGSQKRSPKPHRAGSIPAPAASSRIAPTLHLCDVHVPDHDVALWHSMLAWARAEKPCEVIIGGDFLELESCSQHGGVSRPALLLEDIDAGKLALGQLRKACPTAKITYLEGNHETRLRRSVVSNSPTLDKVLDLPSLLGLKALGIEWVPYGKVVMRGKLGFTHGWYTPDHHAKKHLQELSVSIAYGHTHRPQVYTRGAANGSVLGAFGMPCMRKLEADWLEGRPSGWMQGFGVIYVRADGRFSPYMVLAVDGQFTWGGKVYGDNRKAA